jgi:UDP-2,3-diacylglucosamine pyrophosphatase LpxH
MRALVISDTHFGAWTGRDLLREQFFLERLAPQLEGIDELIFLGDLFDFLFGSVGEAVDASTGLLDLIAANLAGKRLVFLAGNHDHHLVHRDAENRLEAQLAAGRAPLLSGEPALDSASPGPGFFRSFLARRLPGVEIEIAYPTYSFGGVLLTHGHYLDPHARLSGSRGDRLLTRALWSIATGGPEDPKTIDDYESTITLLTEWLYIAAQMPHGTHAQQNVFRAVQRTGRVESALKLPMRGLRRLRGEEPMPEAEDGPHPAYPAASVISPSDPSEHALAAFAKVAANLGWDKEAEQIVFAHTHQPLSDVRCGNGSRTRYWNTGSWIYEPDLGSRQAYGRYLRYAWPGTAILIDEDEPRPRLLEMLADLNPLNGGPGLPSPHE